MVKADNFHRDRSLDLVTSPYLDLGAKVKTAKEAKTLVHSRDKMTSADSDILIVEVLAD